MRFCGIDLHSNNSVVVVTDETDKVLLSRRCPNELPKILALLAPHRDELAGVVVESTYNWYWLVDGLIAEGYVRLTILGVGCEPRQIPSQPQGDTVVPMRCVDRARKALWSVRRP